MLRCIALVTCCALLGGCGGPKAPDRVTYVEEHDPAMQAAITEARASVDKFARALAAPDPKRSDLSIKMPFSDGKVTEHMWLQEVTNVGGKFHGLVGNDPEQLTNVKLGDKASVEPGQISDWMYVEDGKLVGGYTLRALRANFSEGERKKFDESLPFVIE